MEVTSFTSDYRYLNYVPAEDGAVRLMEGYLSRLYQLRDQMREKFELTLMRNLEDTMQEKNSELVHIMKKSILL